MYDWRNAPYGNDDFNVRAEYTKKTQPECIDDRVANLSFTVQKWILPDMRIMLPGELYSWPTVDGVAAWEVAADGRTINISLVQDNHFGFYHCLVEANNGTEYAIKAALNFKGPYWGGSVWWRYKDASTYALGFSLAYGVLCILLSLLWTYIGPKTRLTYAGAGCEENNFETILTNLGYANPGFSAQETLVTNNDEVETSLSRQAHVAQIMNTM